MTIELNTQDARTAKALQLLEGADRWYKIRRKSDGVRFYVIPGCNGHVYWTNLHECSCPDHQHRGETVTCKHRLAVALRVAQLKATRQARPAPPPRKRPAGPSYEEIFGTDGDGSGGRAVPCIGRLLA